MTNIFEPGGTGVGGGTIMGLSKLLTNIDHFEDVIPLTKVGSRKELDITVGDIYGGILSPIDNILTASNFGKAATIESNYNRLRYTCYCTRTCR